MASFYNNKANEYQEFTKGDDQLDDAIKKLKDLLTNTSYYSDHPEQLIEMIVEIRKYHSQIEGRLKRHSFRPERVEHAENFLKSARALEKEIQRFINEKNKKVKTSKSKTPPESTLFAQMGKLPPTMTTSTEKEPDNLLQIFEALDIPVNEQVKTVLELIDEKYIQAHSLNKQEYVENLKKLKTDIEDLIGEE